MADKRLSFRFRFPWRHNPRRPTGKASVKVSPSSQAQPPQETDDIPVSTSPAATESPKTQSPSRLSPSKKSQPAATASSSSSESQQVQEVAISQPPKPLRKIQIITENDANADEDPRETISLTFETSPKAIDIFFSSDKSDSDTLGGDHKQLSESETGPKARKSPEKVVLPALTVEEKVKEDSSPKEPLQENVTQLIDAATDSANQTKDPLKDALQDEKRHKKQESFGSDEKPVKNVSPSQSKISILQKMISSTGEQAPPPHPNKEISQEMLEKPADDVVNLAGENNGAKMQLSSEQAKREDAIPIRRNYKLSPDHSTKAATTTNGNVSSKEEIEDQQSKEVYVNSNVQSINNSVVFNTSVTERNPGVSIFSTDPDDEYFSDKPEQPLQTHKAEILRAPADKFTQQSTVRRRCLRGLFMESSDSEQDINPAKPRRHGCRNVCGKDRKETLALSDHM